MATREKVTKEPPKKLDSVSLENPATEAASQYLNELINSRDLQEVIEIQSAV